MPQLGDLIFKLMGQEDPRQELVAAMAQGGAGGGSTPATPAAAGDTSGAVGTGPGTAAPPQPQAYTSPPDLFNLYNKLLDRQERNANINRGIGLIGASLAQDQNRNSILSAFMGDYSPNSDPINLIGTAMKMQAANADLARKAANRAALPDVAKRYGLDLATAQYLFDTGKLDEVIANAAKPDNQVVQDPVTGQYHIVNKSTGEIGEALGAAKPREIELIDVPGQNKKIAVYKDTKEPVGKNDIEGTRETEYVEDPLTGGKRLVYKDTKEPVEGGNSLPGAGNTTDQKDYNAAMRGLTPDDPDYLPFGQWLLKQKAAGATKVNLGPDGIDYGKPEDGYAWKRDKDGKVIVEDGAPVQIPIKGGSVEMKAAEAAKVDAAKASNKAVENSVVLQDVDRALDMVTNHKDDWFGPTGIAGALLQGVPGSDANRLEGQLSTIRSNLTVDTLAAMRAASPTGGAVGNVSDYEDKMLASTKGSLQTGNAADLTYNLKRIRGIFKAAALGAKSTQEVDEIVRQEAGDPPTAANDHAASGIDDLVKKYRKQ